MIHYQNTQTRKFVVGMLLAILLSCPVIGFNNLVIWSTIFDKTSTLDGTILAPILGLFILLCFIIAAFAQCPSIVANDNGLIVTSCIFIQFAIPWEKVIDIWEYDARTWIGKVQGGIQKSHVRIRGGLTLIHRSLPRKEGQGWRWFRGFTFASAGSGYDDLVHAIEVHTGACKKFSSYCRA